MTDLAPLGRTISLSAERRHDRMCDQFEQAWKDGPPPRIEDALAGVSADERPALFAALLRVELECRPDLPTPGEYQARFPDYVPLVETLLRDPTRETDFVLAPSVFQPPAIPGYELLGRVGAGGMGVVFRARHLTLDRLSAIKMVKAGAWSGAEDLKRFRREAKSVARLDHPNIVRLYEFGEAEGLPYYVMELVEGGSLDDVLDGRPIDPVAAAGLVEPLARAIQYVHDHDLLHRDLKPANILLSNAEGGPRTADVRSPGGPSRDPQFGSRVPKIADFGLAKQLDGGDSGLTATGKVMGTACYMSPEQAAGKTKEIGKPADIYALGAILYELLTGKPPFFADTYELTVVQVLTEDPPRPTDLVPTLPADIEAICLKCLEKDPTHRYASAGDLAEDLRRFREGVPVQAGPTHVLDRDARWARKVGYDLHDLIGCTRWAFVYTATQTNINRKVLLKLSCGRVGSPQHAVLKRQAAALAGLRHPYVLRLHEYGEPYGQPYLTQEFVEGGLTLARMLRAEAAPAEGPSRGTPAPTHQAIDPRRAATLTLRLALGLQGTHEHGVLHLGVNPGAVVLAADDVPMLTGFELARRREEPLTDNLVPPPEAVPPNYVAPELLAGDVAQIGPATDIYALGTVLYDLLVGAPPFLADTLAATRQAVIERPLVPPSRFDPRIPTELEAICLKCLEKDPARRYPTAAAVEVDLQHFLTRPSSDSTIGPISDPRFTPALAYRIHVVSGPARVGDTFPLQRDTVNIGRSKDCVVHLQWDPVSRIHCGIMWNPESGRYELIDYGSKNGTFITNQRVQGRRELRVGDLIQVPDFVLRFETAPVG